jgi:hypothetical protein
MHLRQERAGELPAISNGQDVAIFGEATLRQSAKRYDFAGRHDGNGAKFKVAASPGND